MHRSPAIAGAVRRLGAARASWALKQLHDGDDPTAASARTLRWLLRPRTWLPTWRAEVAVASVLHIVTALEPAARSRLVADLSHAELRAWHRLLGSARPAVRDDTYVAVGAHVPLHVWRRFGRWTDDIDPDPSGDLRDLARIPDPLPDQVAAQERHWATWTGPLATRGMTDAHEYAGNDVVQGHIGNCYLVAALQAIVDTAPERLAGLCRANDNGTWTIELPNGRRTVVSPDIVVDVHGHAVFARRPPNGERELWPLLLEKAYAQLHGGWREIVSGHPYDAIELFTGVRARVVRGADLDLTAIDEWHRSGAAIVAATIAVPPGRDAAQWVEEQAPPAFRRPGGELERLHPGHAFTVHHVERSTREIVLHNPWSHDGAVVLDIDEARTCLDAMHVAEFD